MSNPAQSCTFSIALYQCNHQTDHNTLCAAKLSPRPTCDQNCLCCILLCFMLPLVFMSSWCGSWTTPKSSILFLSESLPQMLATNRGRKEGEERLINNHTSPVPSAKAGAAMLMAAMAGAKAFLMPAGSWKPPAFMEMAAQKEKTPSQYSTRKDTRT